MVGERREDDIELWLKEALSNFQMINTFTKLWWAVSSSFAPHVQRAFLPSLWSEGELRYSEDDWADADLSGVSGLHAVGTSPCNPIS